MSPVAVLQDRAIPIEWIDSSETFSVASKGALKRLLKDVRIIGLGEATHEDGATLEAKVRLVRFLHESMNFNLVVLESSYYGCWLADRKIRAGLPVEQASKYCPGWNLSTYSYPLYTYIAQSYQTDRPLRLAGFDGEKLPHAYASMRDFANEVIGLTDLSFTTHERLHLDSLFRGIFNGFRGHAVYEAMSKSARRNALHIIDTLRHEMQHRADELRSDLGDDVYFTYLKTLETIELEEREVLYGDMWNVVRDHHMGQRIDWLIERLPADEKVIIWAATGHLMRNAVGIERKSSGPSADHYPYYQAGDFIYERYGEQYYVLAFTAAAGQTGSLFPEGHRWKPYERTADLEPPPTGSFEQIATESGLREFVCDLRHASPTYWLSGRYEARPLGYQRDHGRWHQMVDGFYYIDSMRPDRYRSQ